MSKLPFSYSGSFNLKTTEFKGNPIQRQMWTQHFQVGYTCHPFATQMLLLEFSL